MDLIVKTGRLADNSSVLNTYAPDNNYEFSEIKALLDSVSNYSENQPKSNKMRAIGH